MTIMTGELRPGMKLEVLGFLLSRFKDLDKEAEDLCAFISARRHNTAIKQKEETRLEAIINKKAFIVSAIATRIVEDLEHGKIEIIAKDASKAGVMKPIRTSPLRIENAPKCRVYQSPSIYHKEG